MTEALTVRELVAFLSLLPDDMPVVAIYDCGCAEGPVVRVETGPDVADGTGSVVLVVD